MRTDEEMRRIISAVKTIISRENKSRDEEHKKLSDHFWQHVREDEVRHEGIKTWLTVLKGTIAAIALAALKVLFDKFGGGAVK